MDQRPRRSGRWNHCPGHYDTPPEQRHLPVDLAVRGYATITEVPSEGLFGKTDWNIAATSKSGQDLAGYERIIYDGLFDGRATVKLTELRRTFAGTLHRPEGWRRCVIPSSPGAPPAPVPCWIREGPARVFPVEIPAGALAWEHRAR